MSQKLICSTCGQISSSTTAIKGSFLIEIILWLAFLVPGIIYSIWRSSSRYKICKSCGSTNIIPIDSPVGQKLLISQGKTLEQIQSEKESPIKITLAQKLIIGFFVFTVIIFIIAYLRAI